MSTLATTRSRAATGLVRARDWARASRLRLDADWLAGLGLTAGLLLVAFITKGGDELAANTWAEIILTLLGSSLAAFALLVGARGKAWGLASVAMFVALAALTLASVAWSVQPADSWLEGNRTISYLAVFAGAVAAARLWPERWSAIVGAVAVTASVISGYVLLLKVFPSALDRHATLGRVSAPFDYWNATGLVAALGLPACLWAGGRRGVAWGFRAPAVPAIGVLVIVLVLSYSRGALLAAVVGLAVWFALVPFRLRGAIVLAAGAAGGGVATAWALSRHAITHDMVPLSARDAAGHTFGIVVLAMLALLAVGGCAVAIAMDRVRVSDELRRRFAIALIAAAACVPLVGIVAVAASHRGLSGQFSELTSARGGVGNQAGRLTQVSNSRPRYWREGLYVAEHNLFKGVGALGYGTARTRYTSDWYGVGHAHSYAIETLADFGLIGVAVSLGLLGAWGVAAKRAVEPTPASGAAERAGMVTLLAVVVVFGVHSAIDWTWFVPGVALPALVCAGWLAGRGPLAQRAGRGQLRTSRPLLAGAAALIVVGVVMAWTIWQPLRASDADAAALAAASRGDSRAALANARDAESRNPVSVEPLWNESAIELGVGDVAAARGALVRAVSLQPANAATWTRLGEFDLDQHHAQSALIELGRALALDRGSTTIQADVAHARTAAR